MSISKAAQSCYVYYPTAKAINKVYERENRIDKKSTRMLKIKPCCRDHCTSRCNSPRLG